MKTQQKKTQQKKTRNTTRHATVAATAKALLAQPVRVKLNAADAQYILDRFGRKGDKGIGGAISRALAAAAAWEREAELSEMPLTLLSEVEFPKALSRDMDAVADSLGIGREELVRKAVAQHSAAILAGAQL